MSEDIAKRPGAAARDFLRLQTHADHQRLHRHASFAALFDGSLDLDGYRDLMLRLHGFYAPLDAAILQVLRGDPGLGYAHAPRADLLAQDLADLGFGAGDLAMAPRCAGAVTLVTPRTVAGVLYVIEGATLGGATIDRVAGRLLDPQEPRGRRFWSWCRGQSGTRWSLTMDLLDRVLDRGTTVADLEAGAGGTFRLMAEWLAPLDRAMQPRADRRLRA